MVGYIMALVNGLINHNQLWGYNNLSNRYFYFFQVILFTIPNMGHLPTPVYKQYEHKTSSVNSENPVYQPLEFPLQSFCHVYHLFSVTQRSLASCDACQPQHTRIKVYLKKCLLMLLMVPDSNGLSLN